ncbi:FGGY carbohydrate kinase domain-containing protein [Haematobia irritans]|uniref:FGGY carbohydrate kinase domain-containing protein n=1 Tax=Haematobia irritans TaxID=7368 RepID=UPI003F4F411E
MPKIYFVGVDVGTSSARAALITSDGKVLKQSVRNIRIWNPEHEYFEQSSDDIWNAVCFCVKDVTNDVPKEEIVAISFDATCSLVILGENGEPLSVSKNREAEQNIILWMDHRAHKETDHINATKHDILKYVGGQVSLEMELPKLLWLKNNCFISTFSKMWRAFDLPDFLTWRATGSDSRSLCSVVCKWNYDAENMSWNQEFFKEIGLEELLGNNAEIIGSIIQEPGTPVGGGLTEKAAQEMNLLPGTIVGTSLIDAHAGALGMFGCKSTEYNCELEGKMAMICGTSTCHMSLTREPCWAQGVWGPYRSAIIPGYYLNEGGQSAAGLLLDYVIKAHPQYMHIKMKLNENEHIYTYLNRKVKQIAKEKGLDDPCYLTADVHVWPDFHGNRSPIGDPNLKGMISGLNMNVDEESLGIIYLAFVQSLAYGTRHIIESLVKQQRAPVQTLLFCGGLAKNSLYVQNHADICHLPALIPDEQEMVLVGSSMLGACAAKVYQNLEDASAAMGGNGKMIKPQFSTKQYHDCKYQVFLEMLNDQRKYKDIMM